VVPEVRPVRSRRDLTRFIRLPERIYRNEPRWIAPLRFERRRFLDRSTNPFFDHAEAEYFLVWRDGRPVGRISAHIDRNLNEFHQNRWGLFGFFECEDDPEAAGGLLAAAEDWLRERGRDRALGPTSFTLNDEFGILVEGHEIPPMIQQPWSHRYYPRLLQGAGYEKAMDAFMWSLDVFQMGERALPVIWELAEKLEPEHGITIRHFRKRDLEAEARRFIEVYNAAWKDNWGFVPETEREMIHIARKNRLLLDPDWIMFAERDGETVAAALTVPDFNQVLAKLDGRLLPFGWVKAIRAWRRIDRVRVGFLGVKPEYQHTGVAAGLYAEHYRMAEKKPQHGGETGWILETNTAMNRGMEAMGGEIVKRYRIYEKEL
jgi:GNAT superfamily N-acetyltransferase